MTVKQILDHFGKACKKGTDNVQKKFCGKLIGSGQYRDVYECTLDKRYVIKVERDMFAGKFHNVQEWLNYGTIASSHHALKKWFAPTIGITIEGKLLIQRRVKHKPKEFYPKRIPFVVANDSKYGNWGWIGKRFVCSDYSFIDYDLRSTLIKAKWWGETMDNYTFHE